MASILAVLVVQVELSLRDGIYRADYSPAYHVPGDIYLFAARSNDNSDLWRIDEGLRPWWSSRLRRSLRSLIVVYDVLSEIDKVCKARASHQSPLGESGPCWPLL